MIVAVEVPQGYLSKAAVQGKELGKGGCCGHPFGVQGEIDSSAGFNVRKLFPGPP